jgi:predicted signal transduction protein with EAL and GGDEF domain
VVGDQLLCALAGKLGEDSGKENILARMSADEFAILLHHQDHNFKDVNLWGQHIADKMQVSIKYPIHLGEDEISISSSIGIASFPAGREDTASNILRRADTAMHRAKQNGGNQSVIFQLAMADVVEQNYLIERELRKAIPAGELVLYLQSQVDAAGKVVGAESLVRWLHPARGLVPPATFIPIAEESDLIVELGGWTLNEACRILAQPELFSQPLRLSVNISPRHFHDPGFVRGVKHALEITGADATHLTLEVTEGLLIQNINEVILKMSELAALGIHFSLDDFGTGYSSLSYLKRLPIHEIKIDKSFVQDAPTDPDDAALVESILAVAQHMQLDVVAEGVETREQADFLNARAKLIKQGYFLHKPEPVDEWIHRNFG